MGTTVINKVTPVGPYPDPQTPAAGALDVEFTACDVANGNYFTFTETSVLLVRNAGASTYYFTITSQPLSTTFRSTDITEYDLDAGEFACFKFSESNGWADTNAQVHLQGENVAIEFLVLVI